MIAASKGGYESLVEELVKAGADVNLQDGNGNTALILACQDGNLSMWNLLLSIGADVTQQDEWRQTPLLVALKNNCHSWIKCLMKWLLNCVEHVDFHATALHLGYKINRPDIVNSLLRLKNRTSLNLNLFNTLVFIRHGALKMDSKDDVVVSERYDWQMEDGDFYSLIRMLDSDGLRNLLQAGLDVNQWIQYNNEDRHFEGKPLLHILLNEYGPCNVDREGKVRILLQAGADANVRVGFREDDNFFFHRMHEFFKCYDRQKYQCYDKLDWEGVSALGRARRVFFEYSCENMYGIPRYLDKRDEYKGIIQEIKKHVRRYSL
ncbi:kinase D-interacting substrate of 220 kDa-like [Saccostrea echinata]|uniref:kinase D-interacting substrate of 220 kDa-like n=1 Tax=Saccostrea echinata TaxID=191078 RepID=UPI002A8004FE|nr:kinase D-interacting substrate of 220 kDa-like [Saccostrea echinata]